MRIAIVGTGLLGRTLGAAWTQHGHEVVLGSRDPAAFRSDDFIVTKVADAASRADLVVNTVPGIHAVAALTAQPQGWLDDKVLLDVCNPDDGDGEVERSQPESIAEQLQAALPAARVVKALNTFSRLIMVDPARLPEPTSVFLSGDDSDAKQTVVGLLVDLGWGREQLLDLGPLRTARATEGMIAMYYAVRDALGTREFNYRVVAIAGSTDDDDREDA
ncbi:NADPH-dependent F420 reductase [Microbacterium sp. NPDC056569]|uniref:NADPH-dependent F420 reductase n=1 Tax=Microbacterium sp. NPDC056569 TaxID=3345867 RepID=UPI00366D81DF